MKVEDLKNELFKDNYMDMAIKEYLTFKNTDDYDETYKKQALLNINNYLRDKKITSENIVDIVDYFQKENPSSGSFVHWSNVSDLKDYASAKPLEVAELSNYLYEGSADLKDRITRFINSGKNYNKSIRLGAPLFGYLLAGFDLEKYPLYKESIYKDFLNTFGIKETLGDIPTNYSNYYQLCSILLDYFKKNGHMDNPNMLDIQDFVFCLSCYEELYTKIAVKYLYEHAEKINSLELSDEKFVNYINNLDKDFLNEIRTRYERDDKVNFIRYKVADEVLNDGSISINRLEEIKAEAQNRFGENILKQWNNFRILFPFYYEKYKEKVNIELEKLFTIVKNIDEFRGFEFKENKFISDFYGPNNYGNSRCWFVLYPKEKDSHKSSAQLYFGLGYTKEFDFNNISFGLTFGDKLRKKDNSLENNIVTIKDPNSFSFKNVRQKMVQVFYQFKEINKPLENGGNGVSPDDKKFYDNLEVDFNKNIEIRKLIFENPDVLIRQISTALKSGKHIILVGPPGTGKSKLAKEICENYDIDCKMVTAMSDWSTYDTIGGYKPDKDGALFFDEGIFLQLFKNSEDYSPMNKWLIIDEINRADIDKAFGSLFSVLTGDKITLHFKSKSGKNIVLRPEEKGEVIQPNDYEYIIPQDWRIIGTMNTFDKTSLYEMSYAFMRRFAFIPVGIPENIDEKIMHQYLTVWGIEDKSINDVDLREGLVEIWNIINKYRIVGPAIIEDIARYVSIQGDYTSALILYVLPQFEGIMPNDILKFTQELYNSSIKNFSQKKTLLDTFIKDFFRI
ncbi:MAG: AAA family ATPase [Tepidanaerobacteraceae bacterium]|jgi:5-methylcytosine-specific restriction protein B